MLPASSNLYAALRAKKKPADALPARPSCKKARKPRKAKSVAPSADATPESQPPAVQFVSARAAREQVKALAAEVPAEPSQAKRKRK
ncbi:hypothetical protein HK096_007651, partial [Nowakowskiella sp. JEL0078]